MEHTTVVAVIAGGIAGMITSWFTVWSILGPAKMREVESLKNECRRRGMQV